jgi:hypothetical protein
LPHPIRFLKLKLVQAPWLHYAFRGITLVKLFLLSELEGVRGLTHHSPAVSYKGREKEKLLFLEGGERMPLLDAGRGSSRITESMF